MNDPNKINLGQFEFEYIDNKDWICKAIPFKKLTLPERSKFRITDKIEGGYIDHFENCLVDAVKDIVKYLG